VEADQVLPRLGDRGGEPADKGDELEDDVSLAGVPGLAQLEVDLALACPRQSACGEGRTQGIAQLSFKLVTRMGFDSEVGVQREAVDESTAPAL